MFFRRKKPLKVSAPDEREVKSQVSLALSTLDAGIQRTRETRLKAIRVNTTVERLLPHAQEK